MNKRRLIIILILFILASSTVLLCGCEALQSIVNKFRDKTVTEYLKDDKNSMMVLFNKTKKTATLYNYYYWDEETTVCDIPSQLDYQGEMYNVAKISILTDLFGGTSEANFTNTHIKEIVVPSTLESFSISDNDLQSLERITIRGDSSHLISIDGVLFSKDKTSLIYYPRGKTDSYFSIPKEMGWLGNSVFNNGHLENITVEQGSQSYSSRDGVLYSADGTVLRCYPRGKTDKQFLIPKETEKISDENALYYNKYLEEISVEQGNQTYSSRDGVLYSYDGTKLMCYPAGKEGKHFVVPNTVTTISTKAFAYTVSYGVVNKLNELQTIFIPNSVKQIDGGSIYLVDLYCESIELLKGYQLSDNFLTVHLNTSLESYKNIVSMWEDTD